MKRLYIVVEGQTEQEFVNSVAAPYLNKKGILDARPILIRTSRTGRGGMTKYKHLSDTVRLLLNSDRQDFIVTTFIDYFRLPDSMPGYDKCMEIPDETARIEALEASINDDIGDRRFFAYIQRHEFEALLFSSNAGFKYYFPDQCARQTAEIIASYTSPEDINSSPEGAPSAVRGLASAPPAGPAGSAAAKVRVSRAGGRDGHGWSRGRLSSYARRGRNRCRGIWS